MTRIRKIVPYPDTDRIRQLILPGFQGVPVAEVVRFVAKGFKKGVLVTRASSIAFNFLIALLPSSFFLFTLIPFIPIPNFQEELIEFFKYLMPETAFSFLESTIVDVITRKSGSLLLFMFGATVIFSTNGIHALINAFVVSAHHFKSRTWFEQRKISLVLLAIIMTLIALAGGVLIIGKLITTRMVELEIIESGALSYILRALKSIVNLALLFLAISFLYWLAPARRSEFRFFSPGSILATLLFVITSLGFSAYVNHYGQFNKLYGSIGTLMIILIWLYLNSIALLIGFELNVSIKAANAEMENNKQDANCSEDIS
ncbi:MAG: YihY/virulence factor BrkB family protein [Bacteroidales bacterium]|nr:YihY/virulence factor BrkB family protein [Bacteroidales bacterium]